MFNKVVIVVLLLAGIVACSNKKHRKTETGLEYIIHKSGSGKKAQKSNVLQLKFTYSTKNDSVLFNSEALSDSSIMEYRDWPFAQMTEAISLMGEGDSLTFLFSADSVFEKMFRTTIPPSYSKGDKINWNVKVLKIYSRAEFEKIMDQRLRAAAEKEDIEIKSFCIANEIMVQPTPSGMIYIPFKEGSGAQPVKGDSLEVKYTARFLSGQVFDSSNEKGNLHFVIGKGKMIKAWEEGFLYMKEGGASRFVVPSRLAYGIKGYGPVPPDTPVVYDVELVKVFKISAN
jgi:FKBP-type peptidyl-prolyl cis-trans isomerase FkpA